MILIVDSKIQYSRREALNAELRGDYVEALSKYEEAAKTLDQKHKKPAAAQPTHAEVSNICNGDSY
jgi:hypothetical protein